MLVNPFTPSEIASNPEDFFGRFAELRTLEKSLLKGSVAIQGGIGIGKSSLLTRGRLLMEGFDSDHRSKSAISVGDKDVTSVDSAARLLLEPLVQIDERKRTVKFKLGSFFESESAEICRNFAEGRHLATLKRIVEGEYLKMVLMQGELLLLAVDEADKCPVPLARLIRAICTHTQQQGVKGVRFLLAGVSPFFQKMVDEDHGINRFFYKTITLKPMKPDEITELIETKLEHVAKKAEEDGIDVKVDPAILPRIVALSGGHPHIAQLLGSHLVEHENEDPDGIIDARDLVNSLRRICYEDRTRVYDSTLHMLELHGKLEPLDILLAKASPRFPTRIERRTAAREVGKEAVEWLVDHDVLSITSSKEYGLVDEFLRIRRLLDESESAENSSELEGKIIYGGLVGLYVEENMEYLEYGPAKGDGLESNEEDPDDHE